MKDQKRKQYVIYSRKSKYTGKGESIENQVEMCRQYIAAQYGAQAAQEALVYEDEGFSGGNLERPRFKKMMADAKTKDFGAIVVYRLDRISRNIGDFAGLIEQLGEMGIDFISIREQFDTGSPMGRAMMFISSVFSQLERETIAERIRDNMHELAKTGRWLGGTTPTGYESESITTVTVDGRAKKACKLRIVPEEVRLVRMIFDMFLETGSLTRVDSYLLENGFETKRGNQFTRFALKNILTNPVYMIADEAAYEYLLENEVDLSALKEDFDGIHGVMAYNRTIQQTGRAHQIKPMEEWIVSVGKHEGIIPGEKWVQVQKRLDMNKSKAFRKQRSHIALLSGILYCCSCGDYMRPKVDNSFTADDQQNYHYLCTTKERSHGKCCAVRNPDGRALDELVIREIKKLGSDRSHFVELLEKSKRQLRDDREDYDSELTRVRNQLEDTQAQIRQLVSSLAKAAGSVAEDYIMEQIRELHEKSETYKSRLEELESISAEHQLSQIEFDILRQMLSSFSATIDEMTLDQKRAAIRSVVKKVVWDGKMVHVYLFGSDGDVEIPPLEPFGEDSK